MRRHEENGREEKGTGAVRQDRRPLKALPAPVQVLRRGHWRRGTTFEPPKGYPTRRRIGQRTAAPGSRTAAGGPLPKGKGGASFSGLRNRRNTACCAVSPIQLIGSPAGKADDARPVAIRDPCLLPLVDRITRQGMAELLQFTLNGNRTTGGLDDVGHCQRVFHPAYVIDFKSTCKPREIYSWKKIRI